ncbi:uncharacterized protein BYT42DRAFT_617086 [Radiomyces spectabilis]|uniref:uncharacterized protein n=1 Tax=Radiomyces spectabilis TaxID=64574 RepID=UPI0022205981|nr:uncharacterized protein BYT42DRAFT_617086 [Radiomyces spectabilis]KAI8370541.1 hypothetical protein BYT42DRAFT_617086 [Radiomyces spectabilis]
MDTPIEVLRIEHNLVSKELSRFRPCDPESRCYFCREWAQFIYKKHFVWNAKTQEEVSSEHIDIVPAGRYQLAVHHPDSAAPRKESSSKMFDNFQKLLEGSSENSVNWTQELVSACMMWISLPSRLSMLPQLFEPLQFNPFPNAIPLVDDPKEPAQLLDPLLIERQSLCLPSEFFHLLKNLTGDILLSHTQPTCDHMKPDSRSPAELDVDRDILNEKMAKAAKTALMNLEKSLDDTWSHLTQFLQQLMDIENERADFMGKGCQERVDEFARKQKIVPFQDFWSEAFPATKKKRSNTDMEVVDKSFLGYFDDLINFIHQFHEDFVIPHLEGARNVVQKLWDLVVPAIQQMAARMAAYEKEGEARLGNYNGIAESLCGLHPTNDVAFAVDTIQMQMSMRKNELIEEIENLKRAYTDESRPNVAGRLDKVAHKDFKKKIKKIENGYYSLRQHFRYSATQKIFPETLFCKFSRVCIEALMQEGEVMEAVTIEQAVKQFVKDHPLLVQEREILLEDFEEGVQTGRRELAGILGKLFLKEGMRIQGENLALKRQNMLLKSIGAANDTGDTESNGTGNKKKKNKKKKGANSNNNNNVAATATSVEPNVIPDLSSVIGLPTEAKPKQASPSPVDTPQKKSESKEPSPTPQPKMTEEQLKAAEEKQAAKLERAQAKEAARLERIKAREAKEAAAKAKEEELERERAEKEKAAAEAKAAKAKAYQEAKAARLREAELEKERLEKERAAAELEKQRAHEEAKKARAAEAAERAKAKEAEERARAAEAAERAKAEAEASKARAKEAAQKAKEAAERARSKEVKEKAQAQTKPVEAAEKARAKEAAEKARAKEAAEKAQAEKVKAEKARAEKARAKEAQRKEAAKKAAISSSGDVPGVRAAEATPSQRSPKVVESDIGGWGTVDLSKNPKGWGHLQEVAPADNDWESVQVSDSWTDQPNLPAAQNGPVPVKVVNDGAWGESFTAAAAVPNPVSEDDGWGKPLVAETVKETESTAVAPGNADNDGDWGEPGQGQHLQTTGWSEEEIADSWRNTEGWSPASKNNINSQQKSAKESSVRFKSHLVTRKEPGSEWNESTAKSNDTWNNERNVWNKPSKPAASPAETGSWRRSPVKQSSVLFPEAKQPEPEAEVVSFSLKNLMGNNAPVSMPPGLSPNANMPNAPLPMVSPASMLPTSVLPLQNPMMMPPDFPTAEKLQMMDKDAVLTLAQTLHRENQQLAQSIMGMQQEMVMMTSRYTDLITLSREREAQTLQLFEARKQTELEEAKRYILSLEARISTLEEQKISGKSGGVTAGFGNQDLFAGYREEMRSNHHRGKRMWQKSTVVRCGNCGDSGHSSAECQNACRYCGGDHLSETCPQAD